MSAAIIVEDVVRSLARRYGACRQQGKARILTFASAFTCSLNYSKLLHGHKFFYAIPEMMLQPKVHFPTTKLGEFVALICGSAETTLVIPRHVMIEMLADVPTRRVDIFLDSGSYILQTTKHPKRDVTEYLNSWPAPEESDPKNRPEPERQETGPNRVHVKIQWGLISLGRAEGCSVWVPTNDRNLAYSGSPFSRLTAARLPNFGFDEMTRRIVQNIDVLWLARNVILKAFEIEATTSIYSGLLRLNDLVLAQPNVQIGLYLAAPRSRRARTQAQLMRPTFQTLLPKCEYISFEDIEKGMSRLESLHVESGEKVSGLLRGEKFQPQEHYVYPSGEN